MNTNKKRRLKNDEIYVLIAQNIRYYRKQLGITQAELAERVDLSHEFIRRIESKKGPKNFSIDTIYRIAEALNINIMKLFDFPEQKSRE